MFIQWLPLTGDVPTLADGLGSLGEGGDDCLPGEKGMEYIIIIITQKQSTCDGKWISFLKRRHFMFYMSLFLLNGVFLTICRPLYLMSSSYLEGDDPGLLLVHRREHVVRVRAHACCNINFFYIFWSSSTTRKIFPAL